MTDLPSLMKEMRAKAEAATPGPWFTETLEKSGLVTVRGAIADAMQRRQSDNTGVVVSVDCSDHLSEGSFPPMYEEQVANAAHIAASCPANMITVLDHVADLERQKAALIEEDQEFRANSVSVIGELKARIEQAQHDISEMHENVEQAQIVCDSYARENQQLFDRADAAEARARELENALRPFGKNPNAVSLMRCFGHLTREDAQRAAQLLSPEKENADG